MERGPPRHPHLAAGYEREVNGEFKPASDRAGSIPLLLSPSVLSCFDSATKTRLHPTPLPLGTPSLRTVSSGGWAERFPLLPPPSSRCWSRPGPSSPLPAEDAQPLGASRLPSQRATGGGRPETTGQLRSLPAHGARAGGNGGLRAWPLLLPRPLLPHAPPLQKRATGRGKRFVTDSGS